MAVLFIPSDRIGLYSIQNSISELNAALNRLMHSGETVAWYGNGLRFPSTPAWPEGHYYQCGYSTADKESNRRLLSQADIFFEPVPEIPGAGRILRSLRIALYNGRGAGEEFSGPLADVLRAGQFSFHPILDAEIRNGKLEEFDLLLVPGSPDAGECYYAGLGDLGYDRIRDFIAHHGHYMGICGGAYLPLTASTPRNPYWLNIVEATEQEDLDYWRSGSAFVRCRIEEDTHPLFSGIALGKSSTLNLVYWEGPAIDIWGSHVRSLARFESLTSSGCGPNPPYWDLLDNKMAEEAVRKYYNPLTQERFDQMLFRKTALAEAEFGQHRLLLLSPHPEMGNTGYGPRADSLNFLLIYNGLHYLSSC